MEDGVKRLEGDSESGPVSTRVGSLDHLGSLKSESIVGLLDCEKRRDRRRDGVFLCAEVKPDIVYNDI